MQFEKMPQLRFGKSLAKFLQANSPGASTRKQRLSVEMGSQKSPYKVL